MTSTSHEGGTTPETLLASGQQVLARARARRTAGGAACLVTQRPCAQPQSPGSARGARRSKLIRGR